MLLYEFVDEWDSIAWLVRVEHKLGDCCGHELRFHCDNRRSKVLFVDRGTLAILWEGKKCFIQVVVLPSLISSCELLCLSPRDTELPPAFQLRHGDFPVLCPLWHTPLNLRHFWGHFTETAWSVYWPKNDLTPQSFRPSVRYVGLYFVSSQQYAFILDQRFSRW